MTPQKPLHFDKTLTLGLIVTILLQTGGALIWSGAVSARLKALENQNALQASVLERLARLEGQSEHIEQSLRRIEERLATND